MEPRALRNRQVPAIAPDEARPARPRAPRPRAAPAPPGPPARAIPPRPAWAIQEEPQLVFTRRLRVSVRNQGTRHRCQYCPRRFDIEAHHIAHEGRHWGVWRCVHCPLYFATDPELRAHRQAVHTGVVPVGFQRGGHRLDRRRPQTLTIAGQAGRGMVRRVGRGRGRGGRGRGRGQRVGSPDSAR
jgi:hypothetical protein